MNQAKPRVYIFHGEDEFAVSNAAAALESNLGNEALKEANTTRLDGRTFDLDSLMSAVSPMPFLAERRIVYLADYVSRLDQTAVNDGSGSDAPKKRRLEERRKFLEYLESVPPTTALVLLERFSLPSKIRDDRYTHWLLEWAERTPVTVYEENFPRPGYRMDNWIFEKAEKSGGQFTRQAAAELAQMVEDDTRLADQEIHKLLDYVDYARPVQPEDVSLLTVDTSQANIFAMVDALGNRQGGTALGILQRLLDQASHAYVFSMVVRQFRFLLLVREILDSGGGKNQVREGLIFLQSNRRALPDWLAGRLIGQANKFSIDELEQIYQRLLDIDEDNKNGLVPLDLAMEMLISQVTVAPRFRSSSR